MGAFVVLRWLAIGYTREQAQPGRRPPLVIDNGELGRASHVPEGQLLLTGSRRTTRPTSLTALLCGHVRPRPMGWARARDPWGSPRSPRSWRPMVRPRGGRLWCPGAAAALLPVAIVNILFLLYGTSPRALLAPFEANRRLRYGDMLEASSSTVAFDFAGEFHRQASARPARPHQTRPGDAPRGWSFPFVSGDVFRLASDFIFDETDASDVWTGADVRPCDVVFVKSCRFADFRARIRPDITAPFILVSHNSDASLPGDTPADPLVFRWFAQNLDRPGGRLHPIPIGIENMQWPGGNVTRWIERLSAPIRPWDDRDLLLFVAWSDATNARRREWKRLLANFSTDVVVAGGLSRDEYLAGLGRAKFVASPPGNGVDCHRTWEAVLMGAVPVVLASALDDLHLAGPVVIVDDYADLTEPALRRIRPSSRYTRDVVWANTWLAKVHRAVQQCRDRNRVDF